MLTVLKALVRMTKAHRLSQGRWETSGYGNAHWVAVHPRPVASLEDVAGLLGKLAAVPQACVIRGEPLPGVDLRRCQRRFKQAPVTFREAPRQWLMVDADSIPEPPATSMATEPEECVEHVIGLLPEPFQEADCFWQASASAGIKPGCRAHLWFWLSEPVSSLQAKAWLKAAPVDRAIYTPIQPHYTADPLFLGGARDPLPRRHGWRQGLQRVVEVPLGLEEAPPTPVLEAAVFDGDEPDVEGLMDAIRRSRAVRRIWTGERSFPDRSSAHYVLGCALVRAGMRDPDALRCAMHAHDLRHGRDTRKIMRDDYAARTVAACLAAVRR